MKIKILTRVEHEVEYDLVALPWHEWPQPAREAAYTLATRYMDKLRALRTPEERKAFLEPLIEKHLTPLSLEDLFGELPADRTTRKRRRAR